MTMRLDPGYHASHFRILLDYRVLAQDATRTVVQHVLAPEARRFQRPLVLGKAGSDCLAAGATPLLVTAVRAMISDGSLQVMGEHEGGDAQAELVSVVKRFGHQRKLLVITQDRELAQAIRVASPPRGEEMAKVARLANGSIEEWPRDGRPAPVRFDPADKLVATPPIPVSDSNPPSQGEALRSGSGVAVRLDERIGGGGEADVYATDLPGKVAKIYKAGKLTDHALAKLKRMSSVEVSDSALCWPETLLLDHAGRPVGYLMSRAQGRSLARGVFIRPELERGFPGWRRRDLISVAINIAAAVDRLHRMNVVLGDINAENILVRPDGSISLVDLDSVQIEGYPCPVGTPDFTRAVNQGKPFNSYLRTTQDDEFALSILLFKVLLPGKHPFSHAGGEGPAENIRAGRFPYPFGSNKGGEVPDGPWRTIWSHLSFKVKEAFSESFADGRPKSAADWVRILSRYRRAIERGSMDRDSGDEIFPALSKRVSEEVQQRFGFTQAEKIALVCDSCGRQFERLLISVAGGGRPGRCPDCLKATRLAAERSSRPAPSPPRASFPPPSVGSFRPPPRPIVPQPTRPPLPVGNAAPGGGGIIGALIDLFFGRR